MTHKKEDATENARKQAQAQAENITTMIVALEADYKRLEELKEQEEFTEDEKQELEDLEEQASECESREDAETRIHEDALSVEVRSGWHNAGEVLEADEFTILLCTGGPAVRIRGELDEHKQPRRAWLEYQEWFTPWTEYYGEGVSREDLLTYCQQFYFGE